MLIRAVLGATIVAVGCGSSLPEETSPAAQAYVRHCGGCHRAYAPGSMTWPMWEYQVGRMRVLFTQLRKPWLSPEEERLVVDYLRRHAGGQS
jgi:hypothetical protein